MLRELSETTVFIGGDSRLMERGNGCTTQQSAFYTASTQQFRGDLTIRREYTRACESTEICIGLEGEDI